jgi:ATP-dependent helicase/nuclease subunit B
MSLSGLPNIEKKQSYMDELNKLMTECYQYDLTENLFSKGINEVQSQTLKDKLYDLSLLFKYFREVISEKYLTPHEGSLRLASKIQSIDELKQVAVVFDGFYGFTPLQYRVIEALMGICPLVQFVITVDSQEGLGNLKQESDLYYESRKAISTIREMADYMQVNELELDFHGEIQRQYTNGINHLSRHLYKYPIQSLQEPTKGIRLVEAINRKNELETCGLRIHQLIKTGKYRYRDIVVMTSDLDQYEQEVQQIFADYEIPVFIDQKESIQSHPLSHWILSALRTIRYNFRLEDVMSHLKSLYHSEDYQIQTLEVECIQKGVNGYKKWVKYIDTHRSDMPISLLSVMDFKKKMKSARTVKSKSHALYEYMRQCQVYETHETIGRQEISKAKLQEGLVFVKVYEKVIEMIDELVNMLGDEYISLEDYISLVESGLNSIQFAVTPASVDQVLVGDLRRTRFNEVAVVFVLGVNEGKVPYVQNSQQLMSDAERLQLLKAGIEMAPTKQRSLFKEQMNIFMTLCKAKSLLHISYVKGDYEGNLRPAALILMLRKLFPDLPLEKGYKIIKEAEHYFKINPTFSQLIESLQSNSYEKWGNQLNTLYFYMVKAYNEYGLLKVNPKSIEQGIHYMNETPELIKIGERVESTHVSKLESYASCSYKYYLDYILKVKDIEPYEITLPDIGNLFHQCLEIYIRQCIRQGIDVGHVKDQVRHQLIQEAVETVLSQIHEGVFLSSYRYQYLAVKLTRIMKRAVWGIEKQFASSLFRPKESEYQFNGQAFPTESLKIKIDDDRFIYLKGVIDRVDEYTEGTKHYVSVTDYKSGDKNLDLNMLYEGLNM